MTFVLRTGHNKKVAFWFSLNRIFLDCGLIVQCPLVYSVDFVQRLTLAKLNIWQHGTSEPIKCINIIK